MTAGARSTREEAADSPASGALTRDPGRTFGHVDEYRRQDNVRAFIAVS